MSAGSAASNLGYSNIIPNSNINNNFVNSNNSHYPGGFGSNEINGLPGLAGAKSNIDAAASRIPMSGGGRRKKSSIKRKIKNITKRYKMPKKSMKRRVSGIKRRIKSKYSKAISRFRSLGKSKRRRERQRQRGGYSQYQNNLPMTPTYSTGGILSAGNLGLANPVPYKVLPNDTNNADNYNHFLGKGFPSRGH
jgi:hypothetical protein